MDLVDRACCDTMRHVLNTPDNATLRTRIRHLTTMPSHRFFSATTARHPPTAARSIRFDHQRWALAHFVAVQPTSSVSRTHGAHARRNIFLYRRVTMRDRMPSLERAVYLSYWCRSVL